MSIIQKVLPEMATAVAQLNVRMLATIQNASNYLGK